MIILSIIHWVIQQVFVLVGKVQQIRLHGGRLEKSLLMRGSIRSLI